MTPIALRSQIAAEERYLSFLRSYSSLPDDLQERFIAFVLRCVPRPLETGAADGMADGTGHTGDGSLDEAARDAIRESYRLHYEQIGSSLGSPPPEAARIAASSNGNGSAARIGDDCPEFLRRKAVAA